MNAKNQRFLRRRMAVEEYLSGGTLKEIAGRFKVHLITLWRWVQAYKKYGVDSLQDKLRPKLPRNRLMPEIERIVIELKERIPSLSVRAAQKKLAIQGTKLSLSTIWSCWQRYNLAGRKDKIIYESFGAKNSENLDALERAKKFVNEKNLIEAAKIINSLPSCPDNEVIDEIPEEFLSLRRQLDKLSRSWGKIPYPEYYKKIHQLRVSLEKEQLNYSAIIALFREILALQWMRAPYRELQLLKTLKNRLRNMKDSGIKFLLSFHQGVTWSSLMNGVRVLEAIRMCKKYIRYLKDPFYYCFLGDLLTFLTDYGRANKYFKLGLELEKDIDSKRIFYDRISYGCIANARYREALKNLRLAEKTKEGFRSSAAIIRAYASFSRGELNKAEDYFKRALSISETGQLRNHLNSASMGFAMIKAALGKTADAQKLLIKHLPLLRKYHMHQDIMIRELLLRKGIQISRKHFVFPVIYLMHLMRKANLTKKPADYYSALRFARKRKILGFFQRCLVFYPDIVNVLIEKGKPSKLPISFLKMPVFNKETQTYKIKFLGRFEIFKRDQKLHINLFPKDTAFLIHLTAFKRKYVMIEDLYNNFYKNARNPAGNLSHLLIRVRKELGIPKHMLRIEHQSGTPVLVYENIYFITDYQEFEQTLAQAKALERAGEWEFAKKEYLQAFKLFRGEPFKKNFDDWSVDMRFKILSQFETEAINFAKSCIEHGNKNDARKILQKVLRIIPDSEEAKRLSDGLIVL